MLYNTIEGWVRLIIQLAVLLLCICRNLTNNNSLKTVPSNYLGGGTNCTHKFPNPLLVPITATPKLACVPYQVYARYTTGAKQS